MSNGDADKADAAHTADATDAAGTDWGTQTHALLDDFLTRVRAVPELPVTAVWAHGSLAGGDYVEGRSDLDLIAALDAPPGPGTQRATEAMHRELAKTHALAGRLHCSYLAPGAYADPELPHLTWAHQEVKHRPVTPVTRRELRGFGRVLHGDAPAAFLPAVTDDELTDFILRDLGGYWHSAVSRSARWLQDIWVDLGMLTFARASVTLDSGRLITKREALDVLDGALGAPAEVVADIRARRYGGDHRGDPLWITRRARLTRRFLRHGIDGVLERERGRTAHE